jgi:aryl-alcohol dehydrogenase-like predicted oxidoreductase
VGTRRLGDSDLEITAIGFGAWALGGQWGAVSDGESIAAIHRALELGVNWIDTAAAYGRDGHSESVVGRALRGLRERPQVFTKCGFIWKNGQLTTNLKRDSIRREVEGSLRRLGVEAIDLYQIHWREPDEDIEEAWSTLASLKAEGKVRHIGVSNFDVDQLRRCQAIAPVTSLQPPYSMLIRTELWTSPFVDNVARGAWETEVLPFCRAQGIGVIVYSPMASGLLSGRMTQERIAALPPDDWRRDDPDFQEPAISRTLSLVSKLSPIAERRRCSIGELAIAWTLRNPAVTGAIVGFRRQGQVDQLAGAASVQLNDADLAEIDSLLQSA